MASILAMGGTLRQLRDLFDEGTTLGLGDGQLLSRYAEDRDESAFAALVARHGPMVLSTCRAVLRREHDVEDAFQATFLVLAREARSVRAGDALGGWLHRVAYRIAVEAASEARRRRRREAEVAAMTPLRSTPEIPEPDVAAIVHEEVERLPERHRLPVVLCDLEGLTYEQAAGRLRWTVPTLRCRLAKARQRLQGRLARRGLTAGALAVVLAGPTAGARAAVPSAMARAAVLAATAAMVAIGIGPWRPRRSGPVPAMVPLAVAGAKRPDPPREAPAEMIEVRGRVVDPEGKPVAGAVVRAFQPGRDDRSAPETTSAPDGRFRLRIRLMAIQALLRRPGVSRPWVVASAPGFGPGWISAVREPGAPVEATVRLVEGGPPIEGRIVDLEGRPVGGARVRADRLWFSREGRLSDWLDRAEQLGTEGLWRGLDILPASIAAATGPDGRFRLSGIGRDRLAQVLVSAPTIATAQLYVANRDGAPIHARSHEAMSPGRPRTTYYPRRFEYVAEPTRPIEGTIRDKDTGRPIAGLRIEGMVYEEYSSVTAPGVEAATDDRGHYRLTGLPLGPSYRLFIEPGRGQPYPGASFVATPGSPRLEPIAFDMTLKRGVVVRGRVTDKATGRPVPGHVTPFTFADNPRARDFPGFADGHAVYAPIGDDGRYEVVALPGRGIIACWTNGGRYRRGAGVGSIAGPIVPIGNTSGAYSTMPGLCVIDDYHALAGIDLDPAAETATVDLHVEPGRTVTLHIVDPEGRPLGGTIVRGLSDLGTAFDVPRDTPAIEILALDPSHPRRVTIRHEGRKLMGSAYLKGDEAGPLTVRLRPYGILTGRIVDDEGRPLGGLALTSLGGFGPESPADEGFLPGADASPGIAIGRDGRFRIEGLVPGLKYGAHANRGRMRLGDLFRDVIIAPGEVKDLGDLRIIRK